MSLSYPCPDCSNQIPQPASCCPHCGRPGIYWNVLASQETSEVDALDRRYTAARLDAASRGATTAISDFENAVATSRAVIARSESEVFRLASSTRQLYANYYELIEAGVRLPDGDDWDLLRQLADTVLFPHSKEEVRFAALSLDGAGLPNYGSCSVQLRDNMIGHRASVFEENSALFMERHNVKISRRPNFPQGYRASWPDRAKLCVSKLASGIDATTGPDKYSVLLLKQGATSEDDEFVEVHIWGPITVLTIEQVIVTEPNASKRNVVIRAIKSKLAAHNVIVK